MSTILVVDHDPATRGRFGRTLEAEGHTVLRAASRTEALQLVDSLPPDAMLLDLHEPLVDGVALLETFRALEATGTVPAAIVTADYELADSVVERIRMLGADVHFKPLWIDDLAQIAGGLLAGARGFGVPPASTPC